MGGVGGFGDKLNFGPPKVYYHKVGDQKEDEKCRTARRKRYLTALCLIVLLLWGSGRYFDIDLPFVSKVSSIIMKDGPKLLDKPYHFESVDNGQVIAGEEFTVTYSALKKAGFPQLRYVPLEKNYMSMYVFVTAANSTSFKSSIEAVASIQYHFPLEHVIFYDIGLTKEQARTIQDACSVIYRRFDPKGFPEHVGKNPTHTWRALILYELLQDYAALFWFDSTARFKKEDLQTFKNVAKDNKGLAVSYHSKGSLIGNTNSQVYKHFYINDTLKKSSPYLEVDKVLIYNTAHVYENIMKWYVLCSLDPGCSMPEYDVECKKKFNEGCRHIQDDTAFSVLLNLAMSKSNTNYLIPASSSLSSPSYQLKYCVG